MARAEDGTRRAEARTRFAGLLVGRLPQQLAPLVLMFRTVGCVTRRGGLVRGLHDGDVLDLARRALAPALPPRAVAGAEGVPPLAQHRLGSEEHLSTAVRGYQSLAWRFNGEFGR